MAVMFFLLLMPFFLSDAWSKGTGEFNQLLARMLREDPEFKSVDFQTEYYEVKKKRDFSELFLPSLSLNIGQFDQNNTPGAPIIDEYRSAGLTAAFNVFSFGRDMNNYHSSSLELKAQEQRVWSKIMEREQEIGVLLFSFMRESKNLGILKSILDLKEKTLAISFKRYKNGGLSEQDLNKIKLDVSNAKGEYLIAFQELNKLKIRVNSFGTGSLPSLNFPWENTINEKVVAELLASSVPSNSLPQFQAIELQSQAFEERRRALLSNMLGEVQLTFTRSYFEFEENKNWDWRAGIVYTIPLFDQFSQYTEYQSAKAAFRASEVQARFQKRLAKETQWAQKENLQMAFDNFRERREALLTSNSLYNSSLRQFNRGQLSVNELLVDQDRLLRTEQIANHSLYQIHQAIMSLCHSQGKAIVKGCF